MALTAEEVRAEYESRGLSPSQSDIDSEIANAERYGDDWASGQFLANLDERAYRPTASAGGIGGDADLDSDGSFDAGWILGSEYLGNFDVGGMNAAETVAAMTQAENAVRAANEEVRVAIDVMNLQGVFDNAGGSSDAGIAAYRAATGATIAEAGRNAFTGLVGLPGGSGYVRAPFIAGSAPGTSTRPAATTSAGNPLALPGRSSGSNVSTGMSVLRTAAPSSAVLMTSTAAAPAPAGGVASKLPLIAAALGIWEVLK